MFLYAREYQLTQPVLNKMKPVFALAHILSPDRPLGGGMVPLKPGTVSTGG